MYAGLDYQDEFDMEMPGEARAQKKKRGGFVDPPHKGATLEYSGG